MVSRLSMAENRCIVNDIVLKMSFWVILFEESSICSIIFNKAKRWISDGKCIPNKLAYYNITYSLAIFIL